MPDSTRAALERYIGKPNAPLRFAFSNSGPDTAYLVIFAPYTPQPPYYSALVPGGFLYETTGGALVPIPDMIGAQRR